LVFLPQRRRGAETQRIKIGVRNQKFVEGSKNRLGVKIKE
jgi:hypothetical protein